MNKTFWTITVVLGIGVMATLYRIHLTPETFQVVTPTSSFAYEQAREVTAKAAPVLVHIAGAVAKPGLYHVDATLRVHEIFDHAGGLLPEANTDRINLAAKVKDGKRYYVPAKKVSKAATVRSKKRTSPASPNSLHFPLHLNSATMYELEQVPGIGKATAQAIIKERQLRGGFLTLNELLDIKGIGLSTLRKISPYLSL